MNNSAWPFRQGWGPPGRSKQLTREEIILQGVDLNQPGLEIGPSFRPLASKRKGHQVKILDHAPAEELRDKYRAQGIDVSLIEEVDFVWEGGRLTEVLKGHSFHWILASHVIEHSVCLISFLQDCEAMLRPGGILSLAIPDKRYCFDHERTCTSLARIIDIREQGPRVHTVGSVGEFYLKACTKNGMIAWDPDASGPIQARYRPAEALESMQKARAGIYLDIHSWVFTPVTFRELIEDLRTLGYVGMQEARFTDTLGHEFFVQLEKK